MASPETYKIPPSGIFLSLFTDEPPDTPMMGGPAQDLSAILQGGERLKSRKFQCASLDNKNTSWHDALCLWAASDQYTSIYEEYRESKTQILSLLPSAAHLVEHSWNLLFWRQENSSHITCEIQYVTEDTNMNEELRLNLSYTRRNEDGERKAADCRCLGYKSCHCVIETAGDHDPYILWMEIVSSAKAVLSPPMSLEASAIIKPDPPNDLNAQITEQGKLKVLWSPPKSSARRLQYQVKQYFNTTDNDLQTKLVTEETFVVLDVSESCSPLVFEIRCRRIFGVWSDWSHPMVFKSQGGFYFPQKVLVGSSSSFSVFCTFCHNDKKVESRVITWGLDLAEEIPSHQYTAVSDYVGKVTLKNPTPTKPKGKFQYGALYCCVNGIGCQPRYSEIYVVDVNISITCETDGKFTAMTCRWSSKHIESLKDSVWTFRSYQDMSYCIQTGIRYGDSSEESCTLQEDGFYKCVFKTIKPTFSYTMWVEIQHPLGRLRSIPVCVIPRDVVKPYAPSNIKAEMTVGTGYLLVTWARPRFAVFDFMRYQLQYRLQKTEGGWKVLDIYVNESITIEEVDACESYIIQVRCRGLNVPGYWISPVKGPEFWRIMQNNNLQKGDNITLIWKDCHILCTAISASLPVRYIASICALAHVSQGFRRRDLSDVKLAPVKEPFLCGPVEYEVLSEISHEVISSRYVGNSTNYTFTLQNNDVTVTVRAHNALGHSSMNRNVLLSQRMSTVQAVESLEVHPLNKSVVAVWSLLPTEHNVLELVLEWKNLRDASRVRWVFITFHHFFTIEKYQFSLTPVFLEGAGRPKITYELSKEEPDEMRNNAGIYVILPVITATSFLLVITLAISHQRMKRLFWKDVPNPKYCSWAQGVNFQKPDTLENLFTKHRDHLAHSFPLILEPEAIFENLNIVKAWEKETDDVSIVGKLMDDRDSACATSHFSSSCSYADNRETAMYGGSPCQSSVKYATILSNPQQSKPGINGRKLSVSSCDGGFLRANSAAIRNLDGDNPTFLLMAGLQAKQPGKMSSNSTVSSEGFSEPSEQSFEGDSPEKNLYYVGLGSIQNDDEVSDYFSENPLMTYHIQEDVSYGTINFSHDESSEFINMDYSQRDLVKKSLRSYMPQFQIQSANPTGMMDICT
ncbi:PREDICTED: leptin receptor [Nanorana parkeri]|uniref:leptin receptor n=1 Tax=Nanorana parkeri TaxID=125878 RepID=UPI0008544254|nr:PREDICTED: leptin receptor [Nanorana parkeri]